MTQILFEVTSHLSPPAAPRVIVGCREVGVVSLEARLLQFVGPPDESGSELSCVYYRVCDFLHTSVPVFCFDFWMC